MRKYKVIEYIKHEGVGFGIIYNKPSKVIRTMGVPTHNISITLWSYTITISIGFNKRTYVCPYKRKAV